MIVYVLNRNSEPLMPTTPARARKLLNAGKAKVVNRTPFVIKLKYGSRGYKQEVVAGMDAGSKTIGVAAVANGKVIYQAETRLRGEEIKKKMEQRAMYRRTRRGRKTRYRKPRFLNRGASIAKGRLAPSIRHKVESHLRERKRIECMLPVTRWKVELTQFDIHAITNPEVSKRAWWTYQNGSKKNFYNTKAYVLSRDDYTCQKCKSKKLGLKLHVHHIEFRSNGGSDVQTNLITLCEPCHSKLHAHPEAQKESFKLLKKVSAKTKHATNINIVSSQLRKADWGCVTETFGFETKLKRENLGLPKEHYLDAVAICLEDGESVDLAGEVLIKKLISKGDYQQTKGIRSEKKVPTGKVFGFRKFDLIQGKDIVGFVKGKRSSGYFTISDIDGNVIHASINVKKNQVCRKQARGTALTQWRRAFLPFVHDGVSSSMIK